ncbi:vacuolar protein sorting-associated protein 33B isoform X1 [Strongylocentrotus purpuratus]|uniref:Vacuolar protein sorting-associated protein 33B n=1 Tax=Strongylocentrotus purpuratus TaxID=7668 RepID=A0A7M7SUX7_STRPU|nr:vacuolar protein sorting-associated protein 33B isoform X1 [Strongylocentrotus purpuratus]
MASTTHSNGATPSAKRMPDFSILKQLSREHLVHLLESMPNGKDLVIEPDLMRPLDRIAGAQLLRSHGVEKIFKLDTDTLAGGGYGRMYLVRPSVPVVKQIASQIRSDKMNDRQRKYSIIFVPRRLHICDLILEEEGVFADVTMEEFHLDLFPLDYDILSLELPNFFRWFFLDGDQTWIHSVSTSLVNIQALYGTIPHIYYQGRCSKMVWEMMNTLQSLQGTQLKAPVKNEIGHLFLIDRETDMVTPMCTQTTYEGLVDETFDISSGFCEFGPEVTGGKPLRLLLTVEDQLFEDIRNRHISNVFTYLSTTAKMVQTGYNKGRQLNSVTDMKTFVQSELKDLKQKYKSLTIHVGACEVIMNKTNTQLDFDEHLQTEHGMLDGSNMKDNYTFVEEQIDKQSEIFKMSLVRTLRLMCLLSLTQNGLPSKEYQTLQRHFLQSHGYEYMLTFANLKKLGLFVEQQPVEISMGKMSVSGVTTKISGVADKAMKRAGFRLLSRKLNLIPKASEVNLKDPNDMSYVFSGAYTPMTCRLVEQVLARGSWASLDDVTKLLPGPSYATHKSTSVKGHTGSSSVTGPPSERVVMVYFLGGCTFAEINALRLLGKMKNYTFIIATTSVTNGNKLMASIKESC